MSRVSGRDVYYCGTIAAVGRVVSCLLSFNTTASFHIHTFLFIFHLSPYQSTLYSLCHCKRIVK